jgi:hypothetical protein
MMHWSWTPRQVYPASVGVGEDRHRSCNAVASASLAPPGKPRRRGAMLLQQNLTPPPSIDGEQTLDLEGFDLLKDGPAPLFMI